jgi:N-acetylglutamate synthase-like GNAT family acetyltransferase
MGNNKTFLVVCRGDIHYSAVKQYFNFFLGSDILYQIIRRNPLVLTMGSGKDNSGISGAPMIRLCTQDDVNSLYTIINDAASAYKGHIPEDCWHEPYMSLDQLLLELDAGVVFWGYEEERRLAGVMGIQHVQDVSLIRHAYVRAACRGKGIGGSLISHLITLTTRPTLVGTWAAAVWAVRFYEKYGFHLVDGDKKNELLEKYWSITERQVENSVVLADDRWIDLLSGNQPSSFGAR